MKIAIYSHTPIAGAPFLQYSCLKKYAGRGYEVHHIQHTNRYRDGRVFPTDFIMQDRRAMLWLRNADVIHIHNYLPTELRNYIDKRRQKIIATFHSVPRQGNWAELMKIANKSFCIRQPLQMREYNLPTLPNMFDIWDTSRYAARRAYDAPLFCAVYCPTNKHPDTAPGSKAYYSVMPILEQLKKDYPHFFHLIHHTNLEYWENLRQKAKGHLTIDDLVGETFHLTSLEALATGQVVLTSIPKESGYPFVTTQIENLREQIEFYLKNRDALEEKGREGRKWLETNWNPVDHVKEYIDAYQK